MKLKYQSEDGLLFEHEADCLDWESNQLIRCELIERIQMSGYCTLEEELANLLMERFQIRRYER